MVATLSAPVVPVVWLFACFSGRLVCTSASLAEYHSAVVASLARRSIVEARATLACSGAKSILVILHVTIIVSIFIYICILTIVLIMLVTLAILISITVVLISIVVISLTIFITYHHCHRCCSLHCSPVVLLLHTVVMMMNGPSQRAA